MIISVSPVSICQFFRSDWLRLDLGDFLNSILSFTRFGGDARTLPGGKAAALLIRTPVIDSKQKPRWTTWRPHRETTQGDYRETHTDHTGRPHRETTQGDHKRATPERVARIC